MKLTGTFGLCFALALPLDSAAQNAAEGPPPVPQNALGLRPDPGTGYILEEISRGLFWIGNGAYMVMLMVGEDGIALVDAPPSMDRILAPAIEEATGGRAVTHLIYSHLHGDHIGAGGRFEDATIIAHDYYCTC